MNPAGDILRNLAPQPEPEPDLGPYLELVTIWETLPFADRITAVAWEELARALRENSKSIEHARRIARYLATREPQDESGSQRVPTLREIRFAASQVPPRPGPAGSIPPPCPECQDHPGQRIVTRAGTGAFQGETVTATEFCRCAAGNWRRGWNEAKGAA